MRLTFSTHLIYKHNDGAHDGSHFLHKLGLLLDRALEGPRGNDRNTTSSLVAHAARKLKPLFI
jgi:hypothetical protein